MDTEASTLDSVTAKPHAFDRLEEEARDAFRLVCTCGWRSSLSSSPAEPGREWDLHRRTNSWI